MPLPGGRRGGVLPAALAGRDGGGLRKEGRGGAVATIGQLARWREDEPEAPSRVTLAHKGAAGQEAGFAAFWGRGA